MFIKVYGCSVHVSRRLKEEMAWVLDKLFQFTKPVRDLQRSYKTNFQLPKQF